MSLVNEMLRDLDRRRRSPTYMGGARSAEDHEMAFGGGWKNPLMIVAVACLLALTAIGVYLVKTSSPQPAPVASSFSAPDPADAPLVAREPANAGSSPASQPAQADAVEEVTARVAGERTRTNGFELRMEVSKPVTFDVLTRSATGISVLLHDVTGISNSVTMLENVGERISDDGLMLNIDMPREMDFVVYENRDGGNFAVIIEGFWRALPAVSQAGDAEQPETPVAQATALAEEQSPAGAPAADANRAAAPVRTQREPSLEERDRAASQRALRQVRNGQMQAAFDSLYDFIDKNPDAHQSRSTLMTLLYAHQQYDQVDALLDEGLKLAPNLSSFKKIKARMLMANGKYKEALDLLKNLPPAVANDTEYFELMASLYQQTGDYEAAVATYQDLLRIDGNVGRWWAGMGISHEAMGNNRDAVRSFEVALQMPSLESNLRQYSKNRIKSLSKGQ